MVTFRSYPEAEEHEKVCTGEYDRSNPPKDSFCLLKMSNAISGVKSSSALKVDVNMSEMAETKPPAVVTPTKHIECICAKVRSTDCGNTLQSELVEAISIEQYKSMNESDWAEIKKRFNHISGVDLVLRNVQSLLTLKMSKEARSKLL